MNAKLFHFLFRNYDKMNKKKTIGINRRTLTVKIFMVRMEKNIRSIMNCSKKKKDFESTCQKNYDTNYIHPNQRCDLLEILLFEMHI